MANVKHDLLPPGEMHVIHNYEYADETQLLAAVGFTIDDLYKIAFVVATDELWILIDESTPTWKLLSSSPAALGLPFSNYSAIVDPAVSNDDTQGYEAGSLWVNQVDGRTWSCTDATTGAAVWVPVGTGGADVEWVISTSDATPVEMWVDDDIGERLLIANNSSVSFTIHISAIDTVSGDTGNWKFEGAIKNIGGTISTSVIAEFLLYRDDVTWIVVVSGDDGNDALIITVTGDATNQVNWVAKANIAESIF